MAPTNGRSSTPLLNGIQPETRLTVTHIPCIAMINNGSKIGRQGYLLFAIVSAAVLALFVGFSYFDQSKIDESLMFPWKSPPTTSVSFTDSTDTAKMSVCEVAFDRSLHASMAIYRQCLLEKLWNKSKWYVLNEIIDICLGGVGWKMLNVDLLTNWDDVKAVKLPYLADINSTRFNCVQVTLGVGNDIAAEKKLRDLLPSCRFHGADPIFASGKIFKELGPYYEVAVAAESGVLQASVLENGIYQDKDVLTVSFMDFVRNYAKVDHIDYLFMDNEGAEYGIFEQLKPNGTIGRENISICQITVEMHGPIGLYGMNETKYNELIDSTINETAFLPFWSTYPINHIRTYYVNVQDEYCLKTFFRDNFCRQA